VHRTASVPDVAMRGELEPVDDPAALGPYRVVGRLADTGVLVGIGEDRAPVALRVLTAAEVEARKAAPEADVDPRHAALPVVFRALDAHVPFVASPLVQAVDLTAAVEAHGPRTRVEVAGIATALAEHLVALHRAGLTDGRLTPSQVLLTTAGPLVLDPTAPVAGGEPSADIRSFGEILWFAAIGRPLGDVQADPEELSIVDLTIADLVVSATSLDETERPTAERILQTLLGGRLPSAPARAVASVLGRTWKLDHVLRDALGPGAVVEPEPEVVEEPSRPSSRERAGAAAGRAARGLLTLVVVLCVVAALVVAALFVAIR
jgi:hypothetical protein